MRERWKSGCIVVIAGCLIVVLLLVLSGVAIQRRVIAPPELQLCLAGSCLVGQTTRIPACPPRIPCPALPGIIPANEFYTVWIFDQPNQAGGPLRRGRHLLTFQLQR
jgi:hypothetical protein